MYVYDKISGSLFNHVDIQLCYEFGMSFFTELIAALRYNWLGTSDSQDRQTSRSTEASNAMYYLFLNHTKVCQHGH